MAVDNWFFRWIRWESLSCVEPNLGGGGGVSLLSDHQLSDKVRDQVLDWGPRAEIKKLTNISGEQHDSIMWAISSHKTDWAAKTGVFAWEWSFYWDPRAGPGTDSPHHTTHTHYSLHHTLHHTPPGWGHFSTRLKTKDILKCRIPPPPLQTLDLVLSRQ